MRLRTHYLLLGASIFVPVAICCSIAISMLKQAQHDAAVERIEESARLTALVIDADIERAQAVLQALSGAQTLAAADLRQFYGEAVRANAGPGAWIILYDRSGQQLINTRLPFGATLPIRPDPASVTAMLASGKGNVSGMKWGKELKNNFVIVEAPITTARGDRYVIGQAFSPEFFARAFADSATPDSWHIGVVDKAGTVIARRHRASEFVGKTVRPELLEALTATNKVRLQTSTREGILVYNGFTRSRRSGWAVIIGAPAAEVDTIVYDGVTMVAVGLGIALLAALTLTILGGRKLVHYVARASQAARSLGQGARLAPLPPSVVVELDELNDAIMEASARLQSEMRSRAEAEAERNKLLVSEQTARASAEEQNAAKDEFLAMLGHELRNPLSAIASAVNILGSGNTLPETVLRHTHSVLRRQTDHLRKLVDDLLEVNRALMGKLTLHLAPNDLGDIVRRCVESLQAGQRTAGFDVQLSAGPAPVLADTHRLSQIVDNILDNAIKYSPAGGALSITTGLVEGQAQLQVRDAGIGISAELLPSVFTIFVQGQQPLQRAQGGLGIGLSLVRRLVEMHNGTVDIASPGLGHGSTVTVRLPLLDTADAPAAPVQPVAAASNRRVLLVEDNPDARDMMAMLLELRACEVFPAESGAQALALAITAQPEIALIDIGLAVMDGYTLARELRANPVTAHIRLIALTGYGSPEDRRRALEAGFDQHFIKPITPDDLQGVLA